VLAAPDGTAAKAADDGEEAFRFATADLSTAFLLAVVAIEMTEDGGAGSLAALRAANRSAEGVANGCSDASARGTIPDNDLLDIEREEKEENLERGGEEKRKKKQIEPRNEPHLSFGKRKGRFLRPSYNCDGRMVRTRFRRNRRRAVWRRLTPSRRRQRTTMKAYLLQ
jgi:hypothetical protein